MQIHKLYLANNRQLNMAIDIGNNVGDSNFEKAN